MITMYFHLLLLLLFCKDADMKDDSNGIENEILDPNKSDSKNRQLVLFPYILDKICVAKCAMGDCSSAMIKCRLPVNLSFYLPEIVLKGKPVVNGNRVLKYANCLLDAVKCTRCIERCEPGGIMPYRKRKSLGQNMETDLVKENVSEKKPKINSKMEQEMEAVMGTEIEPQPEPEMEPESKLEPKLTQDSMKAEMESESEPEIEAKNKLHMKKGAKQNAVFNRNQETEPDSGKFQKQKVSNKMFDIGFLPRFGNPVPTNWEQQQKEKPKNRKSNRRFDIGFDPGYGNGVPTNTNWEQQQN